VKTTEIIYSVVFNTGWLCIFSNMYFGSFLTPPKATYCSFNFLHLLSQFTPMQDMLQTISFQLMQQKWMDWS